MRGVASRRYTLVDFAYLAAVGAVASIVFYAAWYVYDFGISLLGPFLGVLVSYGLWYVGAILAATIIRKPGAAFAGETLGALIETILPTPGGFSNLVYGVLQGIFAEIVYAVFGYRRFDRVAAALAGAASSIGTLLANLILFRELVFEVEEGAAFVLVVAVAIGYAVSGAIWGVIAYSAAASVARARGV
jgi:energy-coupling factor transport system substrate-specific component